MADSETQRDTQALCWQRGITLRRSPGGTRFLIGAAMLVLVLLCTAAIAQLFPDGQAAGDAAPDGSVAASPYR
ncbi:hypothetical protein [Sphingomonas cavernae]|uniref:hypothetical protein n=1 Tax=Sphingomonas cavernae TaxID=2320861 RepID=UPI00160190EE|nr:hypothetical protein [Sphingomonas cavernae]